MTYCVIGTLRSAGVYGEGCLFPWGACGHEKHGYQFAYTYLTFIVSVAQMYGAPHYASHLPLIFSYKSEESLCGAALYCLWMFYHATSKPLEEIRPVCSLTSLR